MSKESAKDRAEAKLAEAFEMMAKADEQAWRHPLAEATVSLLERGKPVTTESLIERLEEGFAPDFPRVNEAMSAAAIVRLQAIQQGKGVSGA